ncbi:MAG TPA: hypothetical protein VF423_06310, partial [Actinomycetes bacterium]
MTSWRVARDGSTAIAAGLVVLVCLWAAGGVVTDDATTAKVLTGAWFAATGVVALLLARTRQVTAIAVLVDSFVTASLTGSSLLFTSTVDRVVDEKVVVAEPDADPTAAQATVIARRSRPATSDRARRDARHSVARPYTRREAAPDPDRVQHRSRSRPQGPSCAWPDRDQPGPRPGWAKGNKGNQQYVVPRAARVRSVGSGAAPSASSAPRYCRQPTSSAEFLSASGNPTRAWLMQRGRRHHYEGRVMKQKQILKVRGNRTTPALDLRS